jgi:hypothetical protein
MSIRDVVKTAIFFALSRAITHICDRKSTRFARRNRYVLPAAVTGGRTVAFLARAIYAIRCCWGVKT